MQFLAKFSEISFQISRLFGRLIFIHLQCWEVLPFLAFQRQWCTKILCPKDPEFYTPLELNCQEERQLPALEVYKNQSPTIFGNFVQQKGGVNKMGSQRFSPARVKNIILAPPLVHHNVATAERSDAQRKVFTSQFIPPFLQRHRCDALPCLSASPVIIAYIAHIAFPPLLPFFLSPQWFTVPNNKKFTKSHNAAMSPLATRDGPSQTQTQTQRCGALRLHHAQHEIRFSRTS